MRYKSFSFKNYKGIQETSVKLDDGNSLYCITGINESGKTTILKAIEQTYKLLKGEDISGNLEKAKPNKPNFTGEIIFNVELYFDKDDNIKQHIDKNIDKTYNIICIEYKYFFNNALKQKDGVPEIAITIKNIRNKMLDIDDENEKKTLLKDIKDKIPNIFYEDNFLKDGRIPDDIIFYSIQASDYSENKSKGDQDFNDIINVKWCHILDNILKMTAKQNNFSYNSFQTDIVDYIVKSNNGNNYRQLLKKMNSNLNSLIQKQWVVSVLQKIEPKDIPQIEISISENMNKYGKISFKIEIIQNDSVEDLNDRSLGFRWFFSFLLSTYYKQENNTLFLLDEPASNLYSGIQKSIFGIFQDMRDNKSVIIYTTHSPYLYDSCIRNETFITINKKNEDGITLNRFTDIQDDNDKKEYLQMIHDNFILNIPNITLDNNNLLVEGFEDWCFLTLFCRLVLNTLNDKISILFGKTGGSSALFYEIKNCLCFNKKFLILLDNDKGGKDAIKHYQEQFTNTINNYIKTLDNIVDDATDIQTLLNEEEKETLCNIANIQYIKTNDKTKKQSIKDAMFKLIRLLWNNDNNIKTKLEGYINNSQNLKNNCNKLIEHIENYFNLN